eukprot:XP_016664221.1 PREDICTED: zinc finger BED domain-containing protein 4-like [Acyrthosiphon pisum]
MPKPVGASRRKVIDQQVLRMIVKEYFPFSVVEDRKFIKLIGMLNSGYTLPSRKTLTTSLLPVMYNEVYEKVRNDINSNAHYVSLTTDNWISVKNESYTAVTAHYIDKDCILKTYLLSCFKYSESHTRENLKNELVRVVTEWGLQNKIAACTSGNASNITGAIALCNWRHIGCFAHSLNLAFQHTLKEVQEIRDKVKGIVGHFKRSSQAAAKLKLRQEQLEYSPTLSVIQDVVTRWNSTYEMFERILHLKTPLLSALAETNYDVYLNSSDWQIISNTCDILKRFKEISSEKSVSISKVVLSKALINYCGQLKNKYTGSSVTTKFIDVLTSQVVSGFGPHERNILYAEAVILDPRFKNHGFIEGKKSLVNKLVRQLLIKEVDCMVKILKK